MCAQCYCCALPRLALHGVQNVAHPGTPGHPVDMVVVEATLCWAAPGCATSSATLKGKGPRLTGRYRTTARSPSGDRPLLPAAAAALAAAARQGGHGQARELLYVLLRGGTFGVLRDRAAFTPARLGWHSWRAWLGVVPPHRLPDAAAVPHPAELSNIAPIHVMPSTRS